MTCRSGTRGDSPPAGSTVRNAEINAPVDRIACVIPACADQHFPGTDSGRFQLVGKSGRAALQQILDVLSAQHRKPLVDLRRPGLRGVTDDLKAAVAPRRPYGDL